MMPIEGVLGLLRLVGIFAIIPMTLLLTLSFFVLFALRKVDTGGLKAFGTVVTVLLWLAAGLVFLIGVYTISITSQVSRIMPQIMGTPRIMGGPRPGMMPKQKQGMMKECRPPQTGENKALEPAPKTE